MALKGLVELKLIGRDYRPRFVNSRKRLLVIVETDGCAADGISVATGCTVGHRTLRVLDYGKVATTLVDTKTNRAVRVIPNANSRRLAREYSPGARSHWHAYLEAYRYIPDQLLLSWQPVSLIRSVEEILSRPDARVICEGCGEEIMNERQILKARRTLCWSCANEPYYTND